MAKATKTHNVDAVTSPDELKKFVARIEKIEEDQAALADDKKVVYAEVKAFGFEIKVVRALISRRKKDPEKLREFEELLDLYRSAMGDLADTPLGRAGEPRGYDA